MSQQRLLRLRVVIAKDSGNYKSRIDVRGVRAKNDNCYIRGIGESQMNLFEIMALLIESCKGTIYGILYIFGSINSWTRIVILFPSVMGVCLLLFVF